MRLFAVIYGLSVALGMVSPSSALPLKEAPRQTHGSAASLMWRRETPAREADHSAASLMWRREVDALADRSNPMVGASLTLEAALTLWQDD